MIGLAAQYDSVWFFLSGAGAMFVAAATEYYEKITKGVHFVGAGVLIALAAVGLAVLGVLYPIVILAIAAIVLAFTKSLPNRVYIFELIAFLVIMLGLLKLT